jgi:hypothetical protein
MVMEELCSKYAEDDLDLQEKISRFIRDRSIDTVTGIRRMGKENLVMFAKEMCEREGMASSIYPDVVPDGIVLFSHWPGMEDIMESLISEHPGIDIVYGQDLCHQVPAIVRYRRK